VVSLKLRRALTTMSGRESCLDLGEGRATNPTRCAEHGDQVMLSMAEDLVVAVFLSWRMRWVRSQLMESPALDVQGHRLVVCSGHRGHRLSGLRVAEQAGWFEGVDLRAFARR